MSQKGEVRFSYYLKGLMISLALALTLFAGFIWYATYQPPIGGDFKLTYKGKDWNFSDQARPLNILYVGYAKCPDVCPMTLSIAGRAFQQLNQKQRSQTRLLFLSVDVEHDNPIEVAHYASQFDPDFIGLSGSKKQVDFVTSLYNAHYIVEKNEDSYIGYSIAHSDKLFFLDRDGQLITSIASPRNPEIIVKTIKEIL